MKTLTAICLLLLSIHARADLLITQIVETNGQAQTMTSKIKGDMIRTDIAAQVSSITDAASGDVIMLLHEQKAFLRISPRQTQELIDKMRAKNPGSTPPQSMERPKPVATGKKEKVNAYDTEIYTAETPTIKFTYWVSRDFPNAAAVQQQMKKLQDSMQNKMGSGTTPFPDTSMLPGLPVKVEMVNDGKTTTTTVVSVKETSVDSADFLIPTGYTQTHLPGTNAAPGGVPAPAQ